MSGDQQTVWGHLKKGGGPDEKNGEGHYHVEAGLKNRRKKEKHPQLDGG